VGRLDQRTRRSSTRRLGESVPAPRTLGQNAGVIEALTGLRAFAAIWVVAFHFRSEITTMLPGLRAVLPAAEAGRIGVDLFFVLSGFILAYNYAGTFGSLSARSYGRFLWLRLARIYPVHLVTLAALVAVVLAMRAIGMTPEPVNQYSDATIWSNLLMVHAWWGMELTWNYPAWSISAEWLAYLLFPVIMLALSRVRSPYAAVAGVVASYIGMYTIYVMFPTHWPFPVPLVRIGGEFLAGVFLYLVYQTGGDQTWRWSRIAPAALGGLIAVATILEAVGQSAIWSAPLCAILILALARARGWLSDLLGSRWAVYLGKVSYSLYMTHALCQLALTRAFPPETFAGSDLPVRLTAVACYAAVVLVIAVVVYHFIEEPSRKFMRRRVAL
jgi:peptidoglycan/LPS O-acetylase OafA/YrhL